MSLPFLRAKALIVTQHMCVHTHTLSLKRTLVFTKWTYERKMHFIRHVPHLIIQAEIVKPSPWKSLKCRGPRPLQQMSLQGWPGKYGGASARAKVPAWAAVLSTIPFGEFCSPFQGCFSHSCFPFLAAGRCFPRLRGLAPCRLQRYILVPCRGGCCRCPSSLAFCFPGAACPAFWQLSPTPECPPSSPHWAGHCRHW